MSTNTPRFFPEQALGQSNNGPGYEGALNQAMGFPSTLLLTGGNIFEIYPISINPTPENRSDPMAPVSLTGANSGTWPRDNTSTQELQNFPKDSPLLDSLFNAQSAYWLMHFAASPQVLADPNNENEYTEIVSQTQLSQDTSQRDALTGGMIFTNGQSYQFIGLSGLESGMSFSTDPSSFYITVWVFFNQTGGYPNPSDGTSGISGSFFYVGSTGGEVPSYQVIFGLNRNVPFCQIGLQNPTGAEFPQTITYPISLDQSGSGFYQLSCYFKNDGKTITYGGAVGSTDPNVYMGSEATRLLFVPETAIPAPAGFRSLVKSGNNTNAGFSASDFQFKNPNTGLYGLDFVAYRALCEITGITGNDPATQIVNDFNHFSTMVQTSPGSYSPQLNLYPTNQFVSGGG